MMKICWFDAGGNLINIGEWDYQIRPFEIEPEERDEEGNIIKEAVYEDRIMNPLPDGAYEQEREVAQNPDGGWYVVDLPKAPTIAERLKATEDMLLTMMLGGM